MADVENTPEFTELRDLNAPWRVAAHRGMRNEWRKGEQLECGPVMYFLSRGRIRLIQNHIDGTKKTLWYIGPDTLFGETPFFALQPPKAMFECATNCVSYSFEREEFEQICRENPDLTLNLVRSMAHKMRILAYQATSMCLDNVQMRICKFLAQRIVPGSNPPLVDLGMSRQDMASLLGINRVSLYKSLRHQEELGILGPIVNRQVRILKPDAFFRLIN